MPEPNEMIRAKWHVDGPPITLEEYYSDVQVISDDDGYVAFVLGRGGPEVARLIASAPDLLAALEQFVDAVEFLGGDCPHLFTAVESVARNAIAAARGTDA